MEKSQGRGAFRIDWIAPLYIFQHAPGTEYSDQQTQTWMDAELRSREREGQAACKLLLFIVQIPDRPREALCARASLVSEILGIAKHPAVAQPPISAVDANSHVQISHGNTHRPQGWRNGIGEEAHRIHEQQPIHHPGVGS